MQCASMQQINQCSRKWQQINPSSTGLLPTLVPVARRRMRSATLSPATQASKAQQIIPSRSNGGSTLSEGHQASSGADSCSFGQRHLPTQLSSAKQQHGLRKRRSSPNSALNRYVPALYHRDSPCMLHSFITRSTHQQSCAVLTSSVSLLQQHRRCSSSGHGGCSRHQDLGTGGQAADPGGAAQGVQELHPRREPAAAGEPSLQAS